MADVKSGDIVVPGDQLCVIEELSSSHGTYEKNGIVYAATSGGVYIDLKERSIKVLDSDGSIKLGLPVKGDILMGDVRVVYDQRAEISLVKRNGENVHSPFLGEIHISNVTRRFVKSMRDVLSPGDIVRAIALNTHEIPAELSLVGPELGVVHAKCVKCGYPLVLTTHNNLICLRCDHRETREVSNDYGLMFGLVPRPDLAPRRRPREDRYHSTGRRYGHRRDRSNGRRVKQRMTRGSNNRGR